MQRIKKFLNDFLYNSAQINSFGLGNGILMIICITLVNMLDVRINDLILYKNNIIIINIKHNIILLKLY